MTDLVGTYPAAEGHAAVAAAGTVADLLRADANDVDLHGMTRARVDLVAGAGLLGLAAPAGLGGGDAPAAVVREVSELVAGACGTTWFVLTQHRAPMDAAATTSRRPLHERWAAPLAGGDALGAVAFAHLRRPGPPTVRATRVAAGWQVEGSLDWVTGWASPTCSCSWPRRPTARSCRRCCRSPATTARAAALRPRTVPVFG